MGLAADLSVSTRKPLTEKGSGSERAGAATRNSVPLEPAGVPAAHRILDVVGLFCPLPIIRTAAEIRRLQAGRVLEVLADDPVALVDMPNWCKSNGHGYLGWSEGEGGTLRFFIEARPGSRATVAS
jgi:tRNA 2-thiouridine synthesizing protein A